MQNSYTKPSIQSVQPGQMGAPATPTGYATGANPITASRGAVTQMSAAPAMPATPQVQSQPGIPQAWQTQQYANHLQSLYAARPELSGLGGLPQTQGIPGMTGTATPQRSNIPAHLDWASKGAASPVQENAAAMPSSTVNTGYALNNQRLADKNKQFWDNAKANHENIVMAPIRAKEAEKAAKAASNSVTKKAMTNVGRGLDRDYNKGPNSKANNRDSGNRARAASRTRIGKWD